MALFVLDACAMIAYLADEDGADQVESLLLDNANQCYAHGINLAEVYRHFVKHESVVVADEAIEALLNETPITPLEEIRSPLWKTTGRLYAEITSLTNPDTGKRHKISLAVCCAIAAAREKQAALITSDWTSLEFPRSQGIANIVFFRAKDHHGPVTTGP